MIAILLPRDSRPPVRLPELSGLEAGGDAASQVFRGGEAVTEQPAAASPRAALPGADPTVPRNLPAPPGRASYPTVGTREAQRGRLIFVIDDVGNNVEELKPFLSFPGPLTLSILPQRPYTIDAYHLILQAKKLPILHQPMEADGRVNPGPGAIYTSMSSAQIDSLIAQNLQGMSAIRWVNNHEGSKVTSDPAAMLAVLSYLKSREIHFLDSRTTVDTVVPAVDKRLDLPYYERNSIFLDDSVKSESIEKAIESGLSVAQREGYAVMIGHVWDKQLARILVDAYPQLIEEGFVVDDLRALQGESVINDSSGN